MKTVAYNTYAYERKEIQLKKNQSIFFRFLLTAKLSSFQVAEILSHFKYYQ